MIRTIRVLPPPPPPEGDGGGPLIPTRSATHVISAVRRKRCSSDVEDNVEDRVRAEVGDNDDSSSPSSLPRYRDLLVCWIGIGAIGRPQRPNEQ